MYFRYDVCFLLPVTGQRDSALPTQLESAFTGVFSKHQELMHELVTYTCHSEGSQPAWPRELRLELTRAIFSQSKRRCSKSPQVSNHALRLLSIKIIVDIR